MHKHTASVNTAMEAVAGSLITQTQERNFAQDVRVISLQRWQLADLHL
jgi:hypothetical protein